MICQDWKFLNRLANDPAIRPHLGGEGLIDVKAGVESHSVLAFSNLEGAFVLHPIRPQGYEIHTLFPPHAKFKDTIRLARAVLNEMFIGHDCERIFTQLPVTNTGADYLARACGLRETFIRKGVWNGEIDMRYLDLPLDRWLPTCSTHEDQGRRFAGKFGTSQDVVLHRVLGGVIEMFKTGNVVKGVNTWNMWAALCVQPQMTLLSVDDATVEFMGRRWGLCYEGLEVLQCR